MSSSQDKLQAGVQKQRYNSLLTNQCPTAPPCNPGMQSTVVSSQEAITTQLLQEGFSRNLPLGGTPELAVETVHFSMLQGPSNQYHTCLVIIFIPHTSADQFDPIKNDHLTIMGWPFLLVIIPLL